MNKYIPNLLIYIIHPTKKFNFFIQNINDIYDKNALNQVSEELSNWYFSYKLHYKFCEVENSIIILIKIEIYKIQISWDFVENYANLL